MLSLENTGIEQEGVQALARALSGNQVMKSLDLEGNSMGNAGAKALVREAVHGCRRMSVLIITTLNQIRFMPCTCTVA